MTRVPPEDVPRALRLPPSAGVGAQGTPPAGSRRTVGALLALLALLIAATSPAGPARAGAIDPPLRQALARAGPDDALPIVVSLSGRPAPPAVSALSALPRADARRDLLVALRSANATQLSALAPLLRPPAASRVHPLWAAGAVALSARPALVRALADRPEVTALRLDRRWHVPRAAHRAPTPSAPWNLAALGAPELWQRGLDGTGVVVALLDTGADAQHPDLASSWRGGDNSWFDPAGEHATPADHDGHGTQVLGLIVGGAASGRPIGVAPGARWIAAKIYDNTGATSLSAIHRAFQWLLDPDGDPATDDAPDVVNNAWGFDDTPDTCDAEFDADLAALRASGIAVVFAAGNAGPEEASSVSPANGAGVLSVGALDRAGTLLPASSRGPSACDGGIFPALVAPGADVLTTDLTFGGVIPTSYATVSGTSFAAPHVTGAIALLRGAHRKAAPEAIARVLFGTAKRLDPAGLDNTYGHGAIDLVAAHALLSAEEPDADGNVDVDGDASAGDVAGADADADDAGLAPPRAPPRGPGCAGGTVAPLGTTALWVMWVAIARATSPRRRRRATSGGRCPSAGRTP